MFIIAQGNWRYGYGKDGMIWRWMQGDSHLEWDEVPFLGW